jgi:hypothetical protein
VSQGNAYKRIDLVVNFTTLSVRRGADKFLAIPISSTTKGIFLRWVEEVRTTKS